MADGQPGGTILKIVLLVEGDTEQALKEHLKRFLDERAALAQKPKISLQTRALRMDDRDIEKRVQLELQGKDTLAVVALVDVYPYHKSAEEAKTKLIRAARNHPKFYAHVARHDVEAWLLPFWDEICRRTGVREKAPGVHPEEVDGEDPPAKRLKALYDRAKPPRRYIKPVEMNAILRGKDLTVIATSCPEFRAFLNTLLRLAGLSEI